MKSYDEIFGEMALNLKTTDDPPKELKVSIDDIFRAGTTMGQPAPKKIDTAPVSFKRKPSQAVSQKTAEEKKAEEFSPALTSMGQEIRQMFLNRKDPYSFDFMYRFYEAYRNHSEGKDVSATLLSLVQDYALNNEKETSLNITSGTAEVIKAALKKPKLAIEDLKGAFYDVFHKTIFDKTNLVSGSSSLVEVESELYAFAMEEKENPARSEQRKMGEQYLAKLNDQLARLIKVAEGIKPAEQPAPPIEHVSRRQQSVVATRGQEASPPRDRRFSGTALLKRVFSPTRPEVKETPKATLEEKLVELRACIVEAQKKMKDILKTSLSQDFLGSLAEKDKSANDLKTSIASCVSDYMAKFQALGVELEALAKTEHLAEGKPAALKQFISENIKNLVEQEIKLQKVAEENLLMLQQFKSDLSSQLKQLSELSGPNPTLFGGMETKGNDELELKEIIHAMKELVKNSLTNLEKDTTDVQNQRIVFSMQYEQYAEELNKFPDNALADKIKQFIAPIVAQTKIDDAEIEALRQARDDASERARAGQARPGRSSSDSK